MLYEIVHYIPNYNFNATIAMNEVIISMYLTKCENFMNEMSKVNENGF